MKAFVAAWLSTIGLLAYPSIFPTGVTRYDPARAYNCYVLFCAPDGKTRLIDMNGNNVHEWSSRTWRCAAAPDRCW